MCLKKLLLLFSKKITVFSANWCSAILLPLLSVFKKLPVWFLQLARHKFSQRLQPIQEEAEPLLIQYWSVISGLLIDAINIRLELKIELILMSERFLVISSWGKQESLGFWIKQKKFYALINQRCPVQTLWKQTKSRKHLVRKCKFPWNINTLSTSSSEFMEWSRAKDLMMLRILDAFILSMPDHPSYFFKYLSTMTSKLGASCTFFVMLECP